MKQFKVVALMFTLVLASSITYAADKKKAPAKPAAPAAEKAAQAPKVVLVNINTATAAQLRSLPGVGYTYAKKILAGRPYTSKEDLVSKNILPQKTFDKIKDRIVVEEPKK